MAWGQVKWWWTRRQYKRSFRPRRHRHRFVVRKLVGGRVYEYWCGPHKYNGTTFTNDVKRAVQFPSKTHAQSTADNTMLYKYANYQVEKLRK